MQPRSLLVEKNCVLCVLLTLLSCALTFAADAPARIETRIDDDWKFSIADPADAASPSFDDSAWRSVTLPHDWSIEGKIDPKAPMGGGGGFFPAGVAWYRLHLTAPAEWSGKRVVVQFGGVYMNAHVYCNGTDLGEHPYGYTSFNVDLTSALKTGDNLLAVRVDNSNHKNSRWYSGSGIYRHVNLTVTNPVHVAQWGVFVSTPTAGADAASIAIKTTIDNDSDQPVNVTVQNSLLSPDGKEIARVELAGSQIAAKSTGDSAQQIKVAQPALWSPEHPQISHLITRIMKAGNVVDEVNTPFGIRSLSWSPQKGMLLNGNVIKLNGGCIHHDNGVLGSAAFDRAEERKIQILRNVGFNEIRTSHNPPSTEILDDCDRMGMLVMDEAFDCWLVGKNSADYHLYFKDWWQRDIDAMINRDRNHPSVIVWSIGNEIPGTFTAMGAEYNPKLTQRIHELDPSRPVTNGVFGWPNAAKPDDQKFADIGWDAVDLVGCNYTMGNHIKQHEKFPNRILIGTESSPGNPAVMWSNISKYVYVVGDNVWTAMDYLGESGIGRWFYEGDPSEPMMPGKNPGDKPRSVGHGNDRLYPWHGAMSGDVDILGNEKPMAHLRRIVWNQDEKGEKIFICVRQPQDEQKIVVVGWGFFPVWESWTWPGRDGKPIEADVYSRYPKVRLYLNGKLIAEQPTQESNGFRTTFKLTYEPGTLKAVGVVGDKEEGESSLTTVGGVAAVRLTPDHTTIHADGQDLSYVNVEVTDKDGHLQPNANQEITFALSGPGAIAGLGNADLKSEEPYQGTQCKVFHGRALLVIRSTREAGTITLKATADGLTAAETRVESARVGRKL